MNVRSTSNWMRKVSDYGPTGGTASMAAFLALPRRPVRGSSGTQGAVGYTRRLRGLSQFIVLRSGHMCTLEQPNVSKAMFRDFVAGVV